MAGDFGNPLHLRQAGGAAGTVRGSSGEVGDGSGRPQVGQPVLHVRRAIFRLACALFLMSFFNECLTSFLPIHVVKTIGIGEDESSRRRLRFRCVKVSIVLLDFFFKMLFSQQEYLV